MSQNPERDFTLKVSALEIYNETVVDLLNRESGSLRLLDDPEVLTRNFYTKALFKCNNISVFNFFPFSAL